MLTIKIYDSDTSPSDNLIWQTEYEGKKAEKELKFLISVANNNLSVGADYTLKYTDGNGGGFKGTGSLMQVDLVETEHGQVADMHFHFEKWHSY